MIRNRGIWRGLRPPTPSMAVAFVALCVALGGTSYAVTRLPSKSVGASQLKKNAVSSSALRSNSVTSSKVRNNSLTGDDIDESRLGEVPSAARAGAAGTADRATSAGRADTAGSATTAGTAGTASSAGTAGSAGALSALVHKAQPGNVAAAAADAENPTTSTASLSCDSGHRVLGGGVRVDEPGDVTVKESYPETITTWKVTVENASTTASAFTVFAVCVPFAG